MTPITNCRRCGKIFELPGEVGLVPVCQECDVELEVAEEAIFEDPRWQKFSEILDEARRVDDGVS